MHENLKKNIISGSSLVFAAYVLSAFTAISVRADASVSIAPACIVVTNLMGGSTSVPVVITNSAASPVNIAIGFRETARSCPAELPPQSLEPSLENAEFVEGELIVRFADGNVLKSAERALSVKSAGGSIVKEFPLVPGLALVKVPSVSSKDPNLSGVRAAVKSFSSLPGVLYAEPNYIVHAQALPDDALFGSQWGLHNTGSDGGKAGSDISASFAWDRTTGDRTVIVGVIDSGIDYNHEDLAANMWVNLAEIPYDGIDNDGNGYIDDIHGVNMLNRSGNPMDDNGHGTHCAGIIGAVGNNGIGIAGVAWNVRMIALKFLDTKGSGSMWDALDCIGYAVSKGVKVISNSWGGSKYSSALKDVIAAAGDAGVLFVVAAGNDGTDNDKTPQYPSSYNCANIISVAATDNCDRRADWSCYGRTSVDVSAPGVSVLSCRYGGGYVKMSGTSMAAPFVSGVAALLYSVQPGLSPESARAIIMESGDYLDPRISASAKRLNAAAALEFVPAWLSADTGADAELNAGATRETVINVRAVPGMRSGTYDGQTLVTYGDGLVATQEIRMIVLSDPLATCETRLDFGTTEGSGVFDGNAEILTVTNCGVHSVSWNISANGCPVAFDPASGEIPGGESRIVNVLPGPGLALTESGELRSVLTLTNNSSGAVLAIPVSIIVKHVPVTLYVDAESGSDAASGLDSGSAKATLQAAIDAARSGDTIIAAPGTYGPVSAVDMDILIKSSDGPNKTKIQGSGQRCATFGMPCTVLEGFTLSGGYESEGGGIRGGTARRCIITGCTATVNSGGGASDSFLENCVIYGNSAAKYGGGVYSSILTNCTVSGNEAVNGGGVYDCIAVNSIVWGNTLLSSVNSTTNNTSGTEFLFSCTAPLPNGVGNICVNPFFVDPGSGLFDLRLCSPCINAGTNLLSISTNDIRGELRIQDGTTDIGAYETTPASATPLAPESVYATMGTRTDAVEIRWSRVANAALYKVYRTSSNGSFVNVEPLSECFSENFCDTSAVPETVYTYKISSVNAEGESPLSDSATGFRTLPTKITTQEIPSGIRAEPYSFFAEATNGVSTYTWSEMVTNYNVRTAPVSTFAFAPNDASFFTSNKTLVKVSVQFEFPFYGKKYSTFWISNNGVVFPGEEPFTESTSSPSLQLMKSSRMIAPLWSTLILYPDLPQSGEALGGNFSYKTGPDFLTVFFNEMYYSYGETVASSVTLWSSGRIEFKYGPGNRHGGYAGISSGDGVHDVIINEGNSAVLQYSGDVVFSPCGLPDGLSLSDSGEITGTPREPGEYSFGLCATDAAGGVDTVFYTMTVNENTNTLPAPIAVPASEIVFTNVPLAVTMLSDVAGSAILYTTDGTDPSTEGIVYTWTPVAVEKTLTISAVARAAGKTDSRAVSARYYRAYSIEDALGTTGIVYSSSSDAPWFSQNAMTYNGDGAMQSGITGSSSSSSLTASVSGPARMYFMWKTSSEADYDFLKVFVNGKEIAKISGATEWTEQSLLIPGGESEVTWTYVKDATKSWMGDCGWIDCVSVEYDDLIFTPDFGCYRWDDAGGFFNVESSENWTAASGSAWIQLIAKSGPSSSLAAFQLLPNTGNSNRTGTVTVVSGNSTRTFTVIQSMKPEVSDLGTHYGLFAGINKYEDKWCNSLYGCVTDAVNMASQCVESGNWRSENVCILTDSSATKSAVRSKLYELAAVAVPGDTVLFFQSSHGGSITDEGDNYTTNVFLCEYGCYDYYYDFELAKDLLHFKSGVRVIIVIDACHSGGLFKSPVNTADVSGISRSVAVEPMRFDLAQRVETLMRAAFATRKSPASSGVLDTHTPIDPSEIGWLTAADYNQFSWDSGIAGGDFTLALVYGWKNGYADCDADGIVYGNYDGYVSFYEAWNYAKDIATGHADLGSSNLTTAQCHNTNVLASVIAGIYGEELPVCFEVPLALESMGLVWRLSGDALWYSQTNMTYDGIDAMQSGAVCGAGSSVMSTELNGSGMLVFRWKVSSESGRDYLRLSVDGTVVESVSGETDWETVSIGISGSGTHSVAWTYAKNKNGLSGSDCGWVDTVEWIPTAETSVSLSEALDGENLLWISRAPFWTGVYVGDDPLSGDYAKSGTTPDDGESVIETTVRGPGQLEFLWRVSCQENSDGFEFSVNGIQKGRITGESAWTTIQLSLDEGRHYLRWRYLKDESDSSGADCGLIDQVSWAPSGNGTNTVTTPEPIPYDWLDQYGFTAGSYEEAAMSDSDSDGFDAWEEYIAGSNPEDAEDYFRTEISVEDGFPSISWTPDMSQYGRVYTVEGTPDIRRGYINWTSPTNSLHRFFRVKAALEQQHGESP